MREHLVDMLRRSFDGDAWHGPALLESLQGVSADEAAERPIPGAHSIWEITLHAAAWAAEVNRRLRGAAPAMPVEGDWVDPELQNAGAWSHALERLAAARDRVIETVEQLPEDRFLARLGTLSKPLGTGHTHADTIDGLVQHNVYHAGQIILLRKMLKRGG